MFHNLLFNMSLAGSIVMLLYILTYPIAKKYFSLAWNYGILKISIIFFLIPFSVCQYKIRERLYKIFPFLVNQMKVSLDYVKIDTKYAVVINGDDRYISLHMKAIYILFFFFGIIAIIIISFHLYRYWKARRMYLNYSNISVNEEQKRIFEDVKILLKIHRKVELRCSEYCNAPITIGVISPVIIIPIWKIEISKELYQSMIMHELVHIKHYDVLIKFLGILNVAIHWFNPFSYILFYEISNISEMYCDSTVLEGQREQDRKAYGELLLKLATVSRTAENKYIVGILGSRRMKRRILEMKAERKNKIVASIIMMILISMAGGTIVSAYDSPKDIKFEEKVEGFTQDTDIFFSENGQEIGSEKLLYDKAFIDENDNIYEIEHDEVRRDCPHKYTSGTGLIHTKDNSGGCSVNYYEAKRCSICGLIKNENEINTVIYKKCSH